MFARLYHRSLRVVSSLRYLLSLGLLTFVLSGCVTSSGPPPPLSQTSSEDYTKVVTPGNLGEAGAIAIVVLGAESYPLIYTLNDIPLATHYQGYIWLPIMPGTHKFHARQAAFNFPPMQIPVSKGKITYLVIDNSWFGDTPYKIGTRQAFESDLKERSTEPFQVQLKNPVHAFLPGNLKKLIDTCGPTSIDTSCKRAIAEIPPVLISANRRAQITAMIDMGGVQKTASVASKEVSSPLAQKEETHVNGARLNKTSDLPPSVLRDQFMLQIGELFNTGKPAEAVPYFERLNALPVPIDGMTNYYWAQALLASGDKRGAYIKLVRFVKQIDPSSDYYKPAIKLLTKIKG